MPRSNDITARVSADVSDLKPKLDEGAKAVEDFSRRVEDSGKQATTAAGKVNGLAAAASDYAAQMAGVSTQQARAALSLASMGGPATAVAAAMAAVGLAAYQGAEETRAYSAALILSGNAAGASVNQLQNYAAQVAESTGRTKSAVAEVLTDLARSGNVSAEVLGVATEAAMRMERDGGQAVAQTAQIFERLGERPAEASAKLNAEYRYLTVSVWEQITALEAQGKTDEAAALAQKSYADAAIDRAKQVEAQLGTLESAWRTVGAAAKSAWDKMMDLGRGDTLEEKRFKALEGLRDGKAGALADFSVVQAQIEAEERLTAEKKKQGDLVVARAAWDQAGLQLLTKQQRMEAEIAKVRREGLAAGASEESIAKRVELVTAKYAERTKAVSAASKATRGLTDEQKAAAKAEAEAEKATKARADMLGKVASEEGKRAESMRRATATMADEIELLGKSTEEQGAYRAAKLETAAAADLHAASELEASAALLQISGQLPEVADGYLLLAAAHREAADAATGQAAATRQLAAKRVAVQAAEDSAKAWEKFGDDINRSLTDSIFRSFEAGESMADAFARSLENTFKTMALKFGINFVVDGTGQLLGMAGNAALNGILGTGGSNGGAGRNYLGLANNASTAYSAYTSAAAMYAQYEAGLPLAQWSLSNFAPVVNATPAVAPAATQTASTGLGSMGALGAVLEAFGYMAAFFALADPIMDGLMGSGTDYKGLSLRGGIGQGGFDGEIGANWKRDGGWFGSSERFSSWTPVTEDRDELLRWAYGDIDPTQWSVKQGRTYTPVSEMGDLASFIGQVLYSMPDAQGDREQKFSFAANRAVTGDPAMLGAVDLAIERIYETAIDGFADMAQKLGGGDLTEMLKAVAVNLNVTTTGSIDALLTSAADQISETLGETLFPSIAGMAEEAETWAQTFERVAVQASTVVDALAAIGITVQEAFGGATADAVLGFADSLVAKFGDAGTLTSAVAAYQGNYFSQAEREEMVRERLAEQFERLDMVMPATTDGFRTLVESLDLTTDSGQQSFAALMGLQEAFHSVATAAVSASTAVTDAADALRNAQSGASSAVSRLQDSVAAEIEQVAAVRDATVERYEIERQAQLQALDAATRSYQTQRTAAQSVAQELRSLQSGLRTAQESALGMSYATGQAQLQAALAGARRTGSLPGMEEISGALSAVRSQSVNDYSTAEAYARDQAITAGTLASLRGIADGQASAAERSVAALDELIDGQTDARDEIEDHFKDLIRSATEVADDQIKQLNDLVSAAQQQIDALNGIETATLSVAEAVALVNRSIATLGQAQAAVTAATPTTTPTAGTPAQAAAAARVASPMQMLAYEAAKGQGITLAQMDQRMSKPAGTLAEWARTAGLPAFAVGTDFVPADTMALVHRGEKITPAPYSGKQEALIASLIAEVRRLQEIVGEGNRHARRTADATNGNPERIPLVEVA